jgi:outer membrane protein
MKNSAILIKSLLVIFVTIGLLSVSARADDQDKDYQDGFSVGPGVVISDKPYKGMDTDTNVFPFIMYQGQNFYLRGPRLGYKIYEIGDLRVDALANWRFGGYEDDDSDDLEGMDNRDMTAELGVSVSYKDGFGMTRFSFLNDVLGKHDGQLLSLSYGKSFRNNKLSFTPSLGLSCLMHLICLWRCV